MYLLFFFFFSSRRRHTILQGDWSSDVCSSDLRALKRSPATIPAETSRKRWSATTHADSARATSTTMENAIAAKRFAGRWSRRTADNRPMPNTPSPKTITPRPKCAASEAPTKAPKAVPASRCQETARDEPKSDCTTTRAEIGAHQTSGNPSARAASNATTAAIVVLAGYTSLSFHDAGCCVFVLFILEFFSTPLVDGSRRN